MITPTNPRSPLTEAAGAAVSEPPVDGGARELLWCCHVRGPDDVHAAPDYETALKWADMMNAFNWRGPKGENQPPASFEDCLLKAVPALWPWSAEDHAENLPKSIADFTIPARARGEQP